MSDHADLDDADVLVLDRDMLDRGASSIISAKVAPTVLGGHVHRSEELS